MIPAQWATTIPPEPRVNAMSMEAVLALRNRPHHLLQSVLRQAYRASVVLRHRCSAVANLSCWAQFNCRRVHTRDSLKGLSSAGRRRWIGLVLLNLASYAVFAAYVAQEPCDEQDTWYADGDAHKDPQTVIFTLLACYEERDNLKKEVCMYVEIYH